MRRWSAILSDAPRRTRELAYFDGPMQREIAEQIGVPVGAVKARPRTGLRRVRERAEAERAVGMPPPLVGENPAGAAR